MQLIRQRTPAEAALALVQKDYPQYHPLIALAHLAHRQDVREDPRLELEVHRTILPFVQPKLSSVEVKADLDDRRRVVVTLFDEIQSDDGQRVVPVEEAYVVEARELVPLDE